MDDFCGSPLWQYNLTWNITTQPDLTPCFQETILIWIPCLLLWIFAPLEIINIYRSERRYIPVTLLNLFKVFLTTVLCLLSIIELIEASTRSGELVPSVDYAAPIIKALTYILVVGLHIFYRNRGVHTSGLMFLFWLLMTLTSVINFRSLLRSILLDHTTDTLANWQLSEFRFTVKLITAPIVIIQLVLASVADKKAQDPFIITSEDYTNQSPENEASILSLITYWWLNPLMWLGYKRALTQDDLYTVRQSDRTEFCSNRFDELLTPSIQKSLNERQVSNTFKPGFDGTTKNLLNNSRNVDQVGYSSGWFSRFRRTRPEETKRRRNVQNNENDTDQDETVKAKYVGVTGVVFRAFWPDLLVASIFKLISSLLTFASPVLLSCIITFISSDEPDWRGGLYAATLFFLSLFESIFSNREQYITNVNVMRIKTCVTSAIYRKTLRLSNQGRKYYTTGQIVNMMSVDTQRVADIVQNINSLWSAPLQLMISMILLYQQLGMAIFTGLGVMLLNIPLNMFVSAKMRQLQQIVMRLKDKRIKLLSEVVSGIKIIKIHAWEEPFQKRTEEIRNNEIINLTKQTWYAAAITFSFTCLPFVVALSSFATYVLVDSNNILDANKIFVSLSLFNIIRIPLAILPMLILNFSNYIVSIRRVNKFLESEETDPNSVEQIDEETNAIKIQEASFKWERSGDIILNKINLTVPRRKLVAVVGPVGSGKSSLLSAVLGDLEKCEGRVLVDKTSNIAYVPQEAWILNTTFKNNIMFNKVVNEDKYHRVLEACALNPDLKTLEQGDQSEIGEKGINISGGQKQRVSLARAVYADADIYLLDDPLNAVDAHVGRHIFDQIIGPKGMLRDRTRVLVTNKLSVLPEVDHIVVLKDGEISESGTYEELLKSRGVFSQLLAKYLLENTGSGKNISDTTRADLITKELKRLEEQQALRNLEASLDKNASSDGAGGRKKRTASRQGSAPSQAITEAPSGQKLADNGRPGGGNLTGQELQQVGSVGLGVHLNFVRTMGINFVVSLAVYILSSGFTLGSNLWLSDWSNDSLNVTLRNSTQQRDLRLGVYSGLGLAESICIISSTILLNLACLKSSQMLHTRMLSRILKAPLSWFNATPSGRIINRFSKDIDTVDVTIRFNVRLLMLVTLRSISSLILISMFYISTSRQLKRIESTTKSPIYSHFTETITGTSSIRAFGVSQEFILESNHRVDVNNASYYIAFVASRWLAIRLEFLGFLVVLIAALVAVLSRGLISPGIAGLTVTYSLSITNVLSFLVRTYSDYETNVVSVERLLEYTRTPVEPEDDEEPSDSNWPARGEIKFEDFSARYRPDLDLVLNRFNLSINSAERVGLVGRTGAGKSSVTLALFRILEAAEGRIIIDDVDISRINLKVLRSKLSIIPQEPILFTGTIRQNIDPCESHSDADIWRAIELAHLGTYLRGLSAGLEHQVSEGGSNFSVGQKQLFCLARTLLRRSKILVLDEATAAVDVETDNLIQRTIRKEFADSTIVTVAHRLETIQDYDRVVVMEQGLVAELGNPVELAAKQDSRYHQLVKEEKSQ